MQSCNLAFGIFFGFFFLKKLTVFWGAIFSISSRYLRLKWGYEKRWIKVHISTLPHTFKSRSVSVAILHYYIKKWVDWCCFISSVLTSISTHANKVLSISLKISIVFSTTLTNTSTCVKKCTLLLHKQKSVPIVWHTLLDGYRLPDNGYRIISLLS